MWVGWDRSTIMRSIAFRKTMYSYFISFPNIEISRFIGALSKGWYGQSDFILSAPWMSSSGRDIFCLKIIDPFKKSIHSCDENECCCLQTVNISNVNFQKLYSTFLCVWNQMTCRPIKTATTKQISQDIYIFPSAKQLIFLWMYILYHSTWIWCCFNMKTTIWIKEFPIYWHYVWI